MLTSFIIKSLVVLVKFKLLRDERLEYTSNKNIDEMYDLMNAKEEILIRWRSALASKAIYQYVKRKC